jgi:hypothetical protein
VSESAFITPTLAPSGFPRPAAIGARTAAALSHVPDAMNSFVPGACIVRVEASVGTNCVVFRVRSDRGDFALRFEPPGNAVGREAEVRAAVATAAPGLVPPPLRSVTDGRVHFFTEAGAVSCAKWLTGPTAAQVPIGAIDFGSLGRHLAHLRRCLEGLPENVFHGTTSLVYWASDPLDDEDLAAACRGFPGPYQRALRSMRDEVTAGHHMAPEPFHGDLHAENVVLEPSGPVFLDFDFTRRQQLGYALDVATLFHRVARRLPGAAQKAKFSAYIEGYETIAGPVHWHKAIAACAVESMQKIRWIDDHLSGPDGEYWEEVRRRHRRFLIELVEMDVQ